MIKYTLSIYLILYFATPVLSEQTFPTREVPPRLAVFPLLSEKDPDYGVWMSDRLIFELMRHRDIPPWQGRWFELVEPDTIPTRRMKKMLETQQTLQGDDLVLLRKAGQADRALIGYVSQTGTRTLHIRIVNLETGAFIWQGKARDDVKWQWIYSQRAVGEIALGNLMGQLGFLEADRHGIAMQPDEWPLQVAFASLHTSQKALVGGYERLIRENLETNGLFGSLEMVPSVGARLGANERVSVMNNKGVQAILCGSLMGAGKDNAINTVAVALRLVEATSGRILWAGGASAQRVWRKDQFDDLTQQVATELVMNLAQVREGARVDAWADQPLPEDGPGWVNRGMTALERGLLNDAEEAFLNAEKYEESQIQALEGLGRVYARKPARRQRAVDYFYQVLEADTTRADIYYELASVYFDMGTSQCVEMASRAIAIDSSYSAPYRLIGDWFARDDFYALPDDNATAMAYYSRYLALEPDNVDVAVALGEVLLRLKDQRAIAQQILPFLQAHPEAIELLPIAAHWAYRQTQYDTSAVYWRRYLDRVDLQTRSLYDDPTPILSEKQSKIYTDLSDTEKQDFVDRFWTKKDQDLTTAVNERLLEHYQRVWMARQYFSASAYPWDRRGEVFLRYGEPDYRARSGRAPGVMSIAVQQVKDRLYADLYNQPSDGALVGTVFPVRSSRAMMEEKNFGTVNTPYIYEPRDGYLPVTAGEDHSLVPWESWVYVSVGGGMEITFTDEMGSGHFNFAPPPLRQPPGMRSISRIQENAPEVAFERVVADKPEQHRPWWETRELEFYYDVVDARGENNDTRLDVAFALPANEDKIGRGDLTLAIALYDSAQNRTYRSSSQVVRRDSVLKQGTLLTDMLTLNASPGAYTLTVKAENTNANRVSVFQQAIEVESYSELSLQISDPIVAAQIRETDSESIFRRGDLHVVPLPTRLFLEGQELGLYFEIYNLTSDDFGQMRYRVTLQITATEQKEGLRKLLTGQDANPEVALTFEQVDDQKHVQIYQWMDLTQAQQGQNRLQITVEDVNSGQSIQKHIVFRYGK